MDFEKWLQEHGIDAAELDDEKKAKLKAAFENGEDPPDIRLEAGDRRLEENQKETCAKRTPTDLQPTASRLQAADAVRMERERVAAIQEICGGEFLTIEQEAIRAGWSVEDTSQKVLKAMRESRPQADVHLSVSRSKGRDYDLKTLEEALCLRAGIDEEMLLKDYGEQVVELAFHDRDMRLQRLFEECTRLEGITIPRTFCNDTIRAAFSTLSLPGILNNVANKKLLKSFRAQPVVATRLCSEGELNDFKESERYQPGRRCLLGCRR